MPKTRQSFGEATMYSFYCVNVLFQPRWPNYGVVLRQRSDEMCTNYSKVVLRETKDRWIWALITIATICVDGNKLCVTTTPKSRYEVAVYVKITRKISVTYGYYHITQHFSIDIVSCHELAHSTKAFKAHFIQCIALSMSYKTRT